MVICVFAVLAQRSVFSDSVMFVLGQISQLWITIMVVSQMWVRISRQRRDALIGGLFLWPEPGSVWNSSSGETGFVESGCWCLNLRNIEVIVVINLIISLKTWFDLMLTLDDSSCGDHEYLQQMHWSSNSCWDTSPLNHERELYCGAGGEIRDQDQEHLYDVVPMN